LAGDNQFMAGDWLKMRVLVTLLSHSMLVTWQACCPLSLNPTYT